MYKHTRNVLAGALVVGCMAMVGPAWAAGPNYAATTLTGNWNGLRTQLHNEGIDLGLFFQGIWGYNARGGTVHTGAFVDQTILSGGFDFGKMFNWQGGSLHFNVVDRNGHLLDDKADLGVIPETQEAFGDGTRIRLAQLYLEQKLLNGKVDVKAGRMDVGVSGQGFYPFSCDFLNLTFCATDQAYFTEGMAGYPASQMGGLVTVSPSAAWSFKAGVFKNDADAQGAVPARSFAVLNMGHSSGALYMGEVDLHTEMQAAGTKGGLPGTWRFGVWHNTGNYPDVVDAAIMQQHLSGYYFTGKQQLTHNAFGGGLTAEARVVIGDSNTDAFDQIEELMFLYQAPFASRPFDQVGLGIARHQVNQRLANALAAGGARRLGSEYPVELNYAARFPHGISIVPDIQYIFNPSGPGAFGLPTKKENALVFNVELNVLL